MKLLQRLTRNRYLFLGDVLLVIFSYLLTIAAVYRVEDALEIILNNWMLIGMVALIFVGFLHIFRCYNVYWLYGGTKEYVRIILACICAALITDCIAYVHPVRGFFLKLNMVATFVASGGMIGYRMMIRALGKVVRGALRRQKTKVPKDVLIVGAGNLGVTLARDIAGNTDMNYRVVGFVDDDPAKVNMIFCGVKVFGKISNIQKIYEWLKPDEVIIAISSASVEQKKRIIEVCTELPCKLKILPGLADSLTNKSSVEFIREVEVEDLLERQPIHLDNTAIQGDIAGHVVLVTGGGGSIGSELCRQIAKFGPKKLVLLDIYENNVFDLENELHDNFPECDVDVVIASVRDLPRLEQVFETYRPHLVFHAAAHKHVPLMEANPVEAIKNNVFGTYNVASCADKYGVKRFVMISTDKAVNPTNVMGATKRVCEMIVQAMQTKSKTEFVAVRFGNVLNSNGSVLPRFKQQIKKGGPITVTHKDIIRYFMTIPEAAQLVIQAATYAKGGEIFILDMGEPVRIYDLAKNLIRLSGLREGKDIEIKVTGLRPGEKLFEELLLKEEGLTKTSHDKIYIGKPSFHSMEKLEEYLGILKQAVENADPEEIRTTLATVVPTYVRKTETSQEKEGATVQA